MLTDDDKDAVKYAKSLKIAGGIVNHSILVAAAKGIIESCSFE